MKKQIFAYKIIKSERSKNDFFIFKNYDSIKYIKKITICKTSINYDEFESINSKYIFYINRLEYVADVLLYGDTLKVIVTRQPKFIKIKWI